MYIQINADTPVTVRSSEALTNGFPMKLLPVKRIMTDDTPIAKKKIFEEGLKRVLQAQADLLKHEIPAGNLQAAVLTAVHGLPLEPENLEMFALGIYPLFTENAGDYIRYVSALEEAVDIAIDSPSVTVKEVYVAVAPNFSPRNWYELEELGIIPVSFLPMGEERV
ncbi:hypothetical protein [Billgrantia gudaonensis]|uniref:Uncharacterized protein n=1 Tax=Billgrantia gudaonensis TaxID=376427 RepID=A0A1G9EBF7_9GAMM|nr:hypothetical protein [Halomonas gudaonensis]SDK73502.1 hypothetical protein SAMN04487954_12612 [Halomonas gudaonensis]